MNELLKISGLKVEYHTDEAVVYAVNGMDISVGEGECIGIVGETGAGKTTTALSVLGILPEPVGKMVSGEIRFKGQDISKFSDKKMLPLRGKSISMIFQDPMTSLNPVITVGDQILEMLDLHFKGLSADEKVKRVINILETVGIPADRRNEYPFQFSGGMKQRIGIAMSLICEPELIIADEPTTALDVTIQAQILALMKELRKNFNTSIILITHDLGIVAEMCDRVYVVYGGEVVESGSVEEIFSLRDNHPYTEGLFGCIPKLDADDERLQPIEGFMIDPTVKAVNCRFHERCSYADAACVAAFPKMHYNADGHGIRCTRYSDWETEGLGDE